MHRLRGNTGWDRLTAVQKVRHPRVLFRRLRDRGLVGPQGPLSATLLSCAQHHWSTIGARGPRGSKASRHRHEETSLLR